MGDLGIRHGGAEEIESMLSVLKRLAFNNICSNCTVKVICCFTALICISSAQTYVNPLLGNIYVHDPCIIKEGTRYYVFYTGSLVQLKTSPDRITWSNVGSVLPNPTWFKTYVPNNNGTDVWAPDISYRNGQYWLYYSVSTFGSNTSAIGLATSPALNPASWTDQGMVIRSVSSNNYNCIDPNAFQDTDRSLWLVFGSWWTGIKLVQLDTLTGKPAGSSPTIISLAQRVAPDSIEAPFIIKRGSYYYLFVSFDNCCRGVNSTYKIYVGRASAVTGPYTDQSAVAMLSGGGTLIWAGDTRWRGPGGQSLFFENDTFFLVFHSYDANDGGRSKLLIRPLYWTTDGWPSLTPVSGVAGGVERKSALNKNPNTIYKVTGSRFVLPEEFKGGNVMCAVYNLHGKLLFRIRADKGIIDIRRNVGAVQGVYLAQLSVF